MTGDEEKLPDMNEARELFTSLLLGKYIYVFGGAGALDEDDTTDNSSDSDNSDDSDDSELKYSFLNSCER